MATAYGNYASDDDIVPGVVCSNGNIFRKYRMVVLFSSDKGKTWGNPITVADSKMIDPATGLRYIAREGFSEGDWA